MEKYEPLSIQIVSFDRDDVINNDSCLHDSETPID